MRKLAGASLMTPTNHHGFRTPGPANHLRGDDIIPAGVPAAVRRVRRMPAVAAVALFVLCLVPFARGQGNNANQTPTIIASGNVPPGVYIDADGTVRRRQIDAGKELADMRARARAAAAVAKDEKFCY